MVRKKGFPAAIADQIGHYVYAYVDPRNDEDRIFYIGKGKGDRAFQHLYSDRETEKQACIRAIQEAGMEPRIDVLAYGLGKDQAKHIEAVCIDLIGLKNLSNLISGHSSPWGSRQRVEKLIDDLDAEPVVVEEPALALKLTNTFRYGMSDRDLYDMTRGVWQLNRGKAEAVTYAFAVYNGVIKAVYQPEAWHPAGTTEYERRDIESLDTENKLEFTGRRADDAAWKKYVGRRPQTLPRGPFSVKYIGLED